MLVQGKMKYIALLRGINAGRARRVEMKKLKALFESLGYLNVVTYINSGNVIFETDGEQINIRSAIEEGLKNEFGFEIPTLVKTQMQIKQIADAIPQSWKNDSEHKTDVAYLFPEIDYETIMDELPVKKEFLDIRYFDGAVFWNVDRKNYNKSHLNKIISHKIYQFMTVRNVNSARFLAQYKTVN